MVKYIISVLVLSMSSSVFAEKVSNTSAGDADSSKVEVLKDPTQPLAYIAKTSKKAYRPRLPVLQSVVGNTGKRGAIMDNNFYEEGQTVNGYKVARIDKEAVALIYQSKTYTISLYSNTERFSE